MNFKNKGINVLSLFDGISCGRVALDRANIKINKYYSSEIDQFAKIIAQKNYPDTVQLGSIMDIKARNLPKIDLLMGGSPCQGFSFAGKQLNFDDPRSKLFFEFVRILKEVKPKYFLLENVRMKQEYQDIISEQLGVKPIMINSALVSAQNRVRFYWTNIPNIEQPEDRGVVLKDVLEGNVDVRGAAKRNQVTKRGIEAQLNIRKDDKSNCVVASWSHKLNGCVEYRPCEPREFKSGSTCHHAATATDIKGNESIKRVYAETGKSPTLTTMGGGHREPKVLVNESETKKGKSYALTHSYTGAVAWNSIERKQRTMIPTHESTEKDPNIYNGVKYRKLTPMECERLQTVPDGYTEGVSNTQRYKMLGNGWTVDVIAHIFKNITNQ